jgi:1,6-anhydro-N-acetylmuramate kinase
MEQKHPTVIGYTHIKQRRMKQIRVPCCSGRFVGEFVPFYFCPRSPMLFTINKGNTARPAGCQQTIVHLVSSVQAGIGLGQAWAVSDGNAGALHTGFASTLDAIKMLDWAAIRATDWRGKTHQKSAEFLVAEFFPWRGIHAIGCHNKDVAKKVEDLVNSQHHRPVVTVEPAWYY